AGSSSNTSGSGEGDEESEGESGSGDIQEGEREREDSSSEESGEQSDSESEGDSVLEVVSSDDGEDKSESEEAQARKRLKWAETTERPWQVPRMLVNRYHIPSSADCASLSFSGDEHRDLKLAIEMRALCPDDRQMVRIHPNIVRKKGTMDPLKLLEKYTRGTDQYRTLETHPNTAVGGFFDPVCVRPNPQYTTEDPTSEPSLHVPKMNTWVKGPLVVTFREAEEGEIEPECRLEDTDSEMLAPLSESEEEESPDTGSATTARVPSTPKGKRQKGAATPKGYSQGHKAKLSKSLANLLHSDRPRRALPKVDYERKDVKPVIPHPVTHQTADVKPVLETLESARARQVVGKGRDLTRGRLPCIPNTQSRAKDRAREDQERLQPRNPRRPKEPFLELLTNPCPAIDAKVTGRAARLTSTQMARIHLYACLASSEILYKILYCFFKDSTGEHSIIPQGQSYLGVDEKTEREREQLHERTCYEMHLVSMAMSLACIVTRSACVSEARLDSADALNHPLVIAVASALFAIDEVRVVNTSNEANRQLEIDLVEYMADYVLEHQYLFTTFGWPKLNLHKYRERYVRRTGDEGVLQHSDLQTVRLVLDERYNEMNVKYETETIPKENLAEYKTAISYDSVYRTVYQIHGVSKNDAQIFAASVMATLPAVCCLTPIANLPARRTSELLPGIMCFVLCALKQYARGQVAAWERENTDELSISLDGCPEFTYPMLDSIKRSLYSNLVSRGEKINATIEQMTRAVFRGMFCTQAVPDWEWAAYIGDNCVDNWLSPGELGSVSERDTETARESRVNLMALKRQIIVLRAAYSRIEDMDPIQIDYTGARTLFRQPRSTSQSQSQRSISSSPPKRILESGLASSSCSPLPPNKGPPPMPDPSRVVSNTLDVSRAGDTTRTRTKLPSITLPSPVRRPPKGAAATVPVATTRPRTVSESDIALGDHARSVLFPAQRPPPADQDMTQKTASQLAYEKMSASLFDAQRSAKEAKDREMERAQQRAATEREREAKRLKAEAAQAEKMAKAKAAAEAERERERQKKERERAAKKAQSAIDAEGEEIVDLTMEESDPAPVPPRVTETVKKTVAPKARATPAKASTTSTPAVKAVATKSSKTPAVAPTPSKVAVPKGPPPIPLPVSTPTAHAPPLADTPMATVPVLKRSEIPPTRLAISAAAATASTAVSPAGATSQTGPSPKVSVPLQTTSTAAAAERKARQHKRTHAADLLRAAVPTQTDPVTGEVTKCSKTRTERYVGGWCPKGKALQIRPPAGKCYPLGRPHPTMRKEMDAHDALVDAKKAQRAEKKRVAAAAKAEAAKVAAAAGATQASAASGTSPTTAAVPESVVPGAAVVAPAGAPVPAAVSVTVPPPQKRPAQDASSGLTVEVPAAKRPVIAPAPAPASATATTTTPQTKASAEQMETVTNPRELGEQVMISLHYLEELKQRGLAGAPPCPPAGTQPGSLRLLLASDVSVIRNVGIVPSRTRAHTDNTGVLRAYVNGIRFTEDNLTTDILYDNVRHVLMTTHKDHLTVLHLHLRHTVVVRGQRTLNVQIVGGDYATTSEGWIALDSNQPSDSDAGAKYLALFETFLTQLREGPLKRCSAATQKAFGPEPLDAIRLGHGSHQILISPNCVCKLAPSSPQVVYPLSDIECVICDPTPKCPGHVDMTFILPDLRTPLIVPKVAVSDLKSVEPRLNSHHVKVFRNETGYKWQEELEGIRQSADRYKAFCQAGGWVRRFHPVALQYVPDGTEDGAKKSGEERERQVEKPPVAPGSAAGSTVQPTPGAPSTPPRSKVPASARQSKGSVTPKGKGSKGAAGVATPSSARRREREREKAEKRPGAATESSDSSSKQRIRVKKRKSDKESREEKQRRRERNQQVLEGRPKTAPAPKDVDEDMVIDFT
ncbi:hypothetical protein KIPB_003076, partial [Kipferlia bialata]